MRVEIDARRPRTPRAGFRSPRRLLERNVADLAVVAQGVERGFGHTGVDRERRRESLDVQQIRRLRVLRACAGPEQSLRPRASIVDALPPRRMQETAIGPVRALGHRDAEPPSQRLGHLFPEDRRLSASADEQRGHRTPRPSSRADFDAALDAACRNALPGGREVMLGVRRGA